MQGRTIFDTYTYRYNISLANTAITSYINVAQTSTLSRLLILNIVLLYGNIQVCIMPYILRTYLIEIEIEMEIEE